MHRHDSNIALENSSPWSINAAPKCVGAPDEALHKSFLPFCCFSQKSDPRPHSIIRNLTLNTDSLIHRRRGKTMCWTQDLGTDYPQHTAHNLLAGQLAWRVSWVLVHQCYSLDILSLNIPDSEIYIAVGDMLHAYIISTSVVTVEGLERNPKVISVC